LRIFLDKRRKVNLSPADFHLIAIATVKLGKAILISDVVSNNVRMLSKVRAGGGRNGQVAPLNITNERAYRDSPLMSIDRPTFATALLPEKAVRPRDIIVFDENTTKIIKSRAAASHLFRLPRATFIGIYKENE